MKNYLLVYLVFCCALGFVGCRASKKPASEKTNRMVSAAAIDFPDTSFWSRWTPEERRINLQLGQIVAWHLKLVDKQLVLDISRADFVKAGLPDSIYDDALRGLKSMNRCFDTMKLEDVKKEYETVVGQSRLLFRANLE